MMVPVGRLTLVRAFAKSDLLRTMSFVSILALIAPMLGPIAGGLIVGYLHWQIFFLNIPIGLAGLVLVYLHLPDYREKTHPLDTVGLIRLVPVSPCCPTYWKSSGSTLLECPKSRDYSRFLSHCSPVIGCTRNSSLTRCSSSACSGFAFRAAVSGVFTRLGIGGVPFLLPLLYQVGLGFSPVQSSLSSCRRLAAISMKAIMPRLLSAIGYRWVLISTIISSACCFSCSLRSAPIPRSW